MRNEIDEDLPPCAQVFNARHLRENCGVYFGLAVWAMRFTHARWRAGESLASIVAAIPIDEHVACRIRYLTQWFNTFQTVGDAGVHRHADL